jgi:hypothetical protein
MSGLLVNLLFVTLVADAQAAPQPTGHIAGRIVDAATGEPIAGTRIFISNVPPAARPAPGSVPATPLAPFIIETNANGVFEVAGVPAGRWRVNAQKPGYVQFGGAGSPLTIEVSRGSVLVPEIRLERGGAIAGRVLDSRGNVLSGVSVQAYELVRANGSVRPTQAGMSVPTNDLGEFRLSGLPPGQYYVAAVARPTPINPFGGGQPPAAGVTYVTTFYPGFTEVREATSINVARGLTTNGIDFPMRPVAAYQVSGIVVDAQGRAVAGALVRLAEAKSATLNLQQGGPSARDGTFRIVNVPPGKYQATAIVPVVVQSGGATVTRVGPSAGPETEVVVQAADVTDVRVVIR